MRAEADRLDPPARKTVTWEGSTYHLDAEGVTSSGVTYWTRGFIDAVVLPLLADAPDGPIPDETVQFAMARYDLSSADRMESWRVALAAVRGLPGMAVVRAGKPPEVLAWAAMHEGTLLRRCPTREEAVAYARSQTPPDTVMPRRIVAIIADPGEGAA